MIAVINVGTGNIRSIFLALKEVAPKEKICVTSNAQDLKNAKKIVFPGQGSMNGCLERLKQTGIAEQIKDVISDRPFLGICLGKQILFDFSEEGNSIGLGLIPGKVVKFQDSMFGNKELKPFFKIPHMGWNQVKIRKKHHLFNGINFSLSKDGGNSEWFYFVHSYFVQPKEKEISIASTDYGVSFTSVIARDNLVATQFDPEKSSKSGLIFLKNFVSWKL